MKIDEPSKLSEHDLGRSLDFSSDRYAPTDRLSSAILCWLLLSRTVKEPCQVLPIPLVQECPKALLRSSAGVVACCRTGRGTV